MSEWQLHHVEDTLDPRADDPADFPLLVCEGADHAILGLRSLGGGAGWFKVSPPADPSSTSLEEIDPGIEDWESVDLSTVGPIAAADLPAVRAFTREWADVCARDGYAEAAQALRQTAAALG